MDLKSLEALGITAESLAQRIVDQAVESLLSDTGYDEDGEKTSTYETRFKREIEKKVTEAADAKITALAAVHLVPRVGEMIEAADMRQTNKYGEPTTPRQTFKEFIAARAEAYMTENVDTNGNSKSQAGDPYNWRSNGSRLTVLMRMYIKTTLEAHAQAAVSDINKVIAKNIEQAAMSAITAAAAALKVQVSA